MVVTDSTTGKKKRQPRPAGVKQQKTAKVRYTRNPVRWGFPLPPPCVPFLSACLLDSSPFLFLPAQRRKVTWGEDVCQFESPSPQAALALSQGAQSHPIMASELIARARIGLIEAGHAHFARIHASL